MHERNETELVHEIRESENQLLKRINMRSKRTFLISDLNSVMSSFNVLFGIILANDRT